MLRNWFRSWLGLTVSTKKAVGSDSIYESPRYQCLQTAMNRGFENGQNRSLIDILAEADAMYEYLTGRVAP